MYAVRVGDIDQIGRPYDRLRKRRRMVAIVRVVVDIVAIGLPEAERTFAWFSTHMRPLCGS